MVVPRVIEVGAGVEEEYATRRFLKAESPCAKDTTEARERAHLQSTAPVHESDPGRCDPEDADDTCAPVGGW